MRSRSTGSLQLLPTLARKIIGPTLQLDPTRVSFPQSGQTKLTFLIPLNLAIPLPEPHPIYPAITIDLRMNDVLF